MPQNRLDGRPAQPSARALQGILVVDDHDLVRLGVRALLQSQTPDAGRVAEVFEADTLARALTVYAGAEARIGLVLLDLALPDAQGLSGLVAFRARFPAARVVVLSGTVDARMAQGALAEGASAFLPKSADLKEVVSFIRACGLLDASEARPGMSSTPAAATSPLPPGALAELTPRQTEVLQWLLEGKANREIAQLAHLSEGTVKNHVSTLLLLFGMRSRAQLISQLR
ncbi:LuxR family transcriptional regulator [Variovorax sp. PAMC 28711]|nr:response regulator transcription factor [Variovorax sp. PAMC 28711]AMM25802.1 LuxR family transcriptional regulator [Variovorax sp. PAMC 28711]